MVSPPVSDNRDPKSLLWFKKADVERRASNITLEHLTCCADSRHLFCTSNMESTQPGQLSWRLSSHPITLLWFLGFRICEYARAGDPDAQWEMDDAIDS